MMQKYIIIYLHTLNETEGVAASWIIVDTSGTITTTVHRGDLSQLVVPAELPSYVIIPMQDILLTSAHLPKLSRQQLMQALPYALEEQLIDDIANLHFAIGSYQPDQSLPIAVVSKQKMTAWLHLLGQLNITPRALIPAVFVLPYTEHSYHINCDHDNCLVRVSKWGGFACEQDNVETLLDLQPNQTTIDVIRTNYSTQQLLEKLPTDIERVSFINLLQHAYQAKPQSTKIKKHWLIAGYLALVWVALTLATQAVSFFILHHKTSQIETQINQIYKQNFPNASSVVAPRERMTEKLHSLSKRANNGFLVLLSELGNSLQKNPGIHIKNLDFREQQITLELTAATFDNVDTLIQHLKQKGLAVKQQNAAESGTQVTTTLLIRAGAL